MLIKPPILEIQLFQNLTFQNPRSRSWMGSKFNQSFHSLDTFFSKSQVKVIAQRHSGSNMMATSYWLAYLLFHVNQPSHSWNTAFPNLTLKIQGQGHGLPIPLIWLFQNLTLKIKGQGHKPIMMLHNYRFQQFHRTLSSVNPSSGLRDMGSAKSGL